MAKKYLTGINLNRNELQNAVIQNLASAPSSPTPGLVYYDTTLSKFGTYNGSEWVYMGDMDGSDYVDLTTAQSVGGVKTFTSFPVTPSSAPSTSYQVANKKYVDDSIQAAGGYTDKQAQDAVGTILTDTATADFTYDEPNSEITLDVLDSPQLQGQNGAYYLNRANHTGTQSADTIVDGSTNRVFTAADETKLNYITVTAATDLDAIRTRVNDLDAAVVLKGGWAANAGTFPGAGAAQAGWSYIVTTAGIVDGVDFSVNDRLLAIVDNASTTVYANNWLKLDYTDQVLTVNGQTGAVVLDADDIDDTSTSHKFVTAADITKLANTSGTNTGDEVDATTTVKGIVELATKAEADAKTDTTRAVTPSGLADFTRKHTSTIGGSTSIAVTHGLGTQWVTAQAFDASTNELVECDITLTSSTQTTFGFTSAPAANSIRVVITG